MNFRELTFAGLPSAAAGRPELIQWWADAPERILSKEWPNRVVNAWLERPTGAATSQPGEK